VIARGRALYPAPTDTVSGQRSDQANFPHGRVLIIYMRSLGSALHWICNHAVTTVLLLAYTVMSLLIVEQGRIIANQRTLIRQLFTDSLELNAKKMHDLRSLHDHSLQK
jgi:hypothetical protein